MLNSDVKVTEAKKEDITTQISVDSSTAIEINSAEFISTISMSDTSSEIFSTNKYIRMYTYTLAECWF